MTILQSNLNNLDLQAFTSDHEVNKHDQHKTISDHPLHRHPQPETITQHYYLFGHPISHSAAPYLHNHIWKHLYPDRQFSLCDTSEMSIEEIKSKMISNDQFRGAAITMPHKSTVISLPGLLHALTPAAEATGSVNTIVQDRLTRVRTGTNTDTLGIRHALAQRLGGSGVFEANRYAGLVIGSGATTRSAVYALDQLNLSPIYLINRDYEETLGVLGQFAHLDLRPILDEDDFKSERLNRYSRPIPVAVGCIPALEPETESEKMVYELVDRFLKTPYQLLDLQKEDKSLCEVGFLKAPDRPVFLEMAYKPRWTPILAKADGAGWQTIEGIQAMIEQGLAQSRMWITGDARVEEKIDENGKYIISQELEDQVRKLIEGLGDL